MKCIESSETAYPFKAGTLPAQVQLAQACRLISKLMNADAFPGHYSYYTMGDGDCSITMVAMKDAGLVVPVAGSRWQMTSSGMTRVIHSRHVGQWERVFQRRSALPFAEMTHWELLDYLLEKNWILQPLPFRKTVPPMFVDKEHDQIGIAYYSSKKL